MKTKLCLVDCYGNSFDDIPLTEFCGHYLEIENYKEDCLYSYYDDLYKLAIEYKKNANNDKVSQVGFCTKCTIVEGDENSVRWGKVRSNLIIAFVFEPHSCIGTNPVIESILLLQKGELQNIRVAPTLKGSPN